MIKHLYTDNFNVDTNEVTVEDIMVTIITGICLCIKNQLKKNSSKRELELHGIFEVNEEYLISLIISLIINLALSV